MKKNKNMIKQIEEKLVEEKENNKNMIKQLEESRIKKKIKI